MQNQEIEKMIKKMNSIISKQEKQLSRQNKEINKLKSITTKQESINKKIETKKEKLSPTKFNDYMTKQQFKEFMKTINKSIQNQNQKIKYVQTKHDKLANIVQPRNNTAVMINFYVQRRQLIDDEGEIYYPKIYKYGNMDKIQYYEDKQYSLCFEANVIVPTNFINKYMTHEFYNKNRDGDKVITDFKEFICNLDDNIKTSIGLIQLSNDIEGFKIVRKTQHNEMYVKPKRFEMIIKNDTHFNAINSNYTKYKLKLEASDFKDLELNHCEYLQNNFRPRSCLLTVIINKFYNRFNFLKADGKRRNKELTYEYLCEILKIPNNPTDNGVSIDKVVELFFKRFNFAELYIYDNYMNLIKTHEATADHKTVLRLILYDNHVFELNDNLKSLEQKVNYEDDERKDLTVSDKYNIMKPVENVIEVFCQDFEAIFKTIKENANAEESIQLKIITCYDINNLLFKLLESGYIPKVSFSTHLYRISLCIDKLKIQILPADNNPDLGQLVSYSNLEEYQAYNNAYEKFYTSIIRKEYLSDSHTSVIEIEDTYKIKPIMGYFDKFESKTYNTIDENKAYTECLRSIKQIPIFNYFDVYTTYNNEPLEDLTYYIIEVLENSKRASILYDSKFSRTYGYILKQTNIKYKIIYYRRPLNIEEVNFKIPVDDLYNANIKTEMKKAIANITIGLLEKKTNKAELSKIFTDYNEANYYNIKYNGKILPLIGECQFETVSEFDPIENRFIQRCNKIEDKKVYLVAINEQKRLINGFTPIKDMIYLNERVKLLSQFDKLNKLGYKVRGIKTDCIFYEGDDIKIRKHFSLSNKIGDFKIEENKYLINKPIKMDDNELIKINNFLIETKEFKNELDTKIINEYITNHKHTLIKGMFPGVGKSTLAKNFDKNSLFITPYNKLCQVLRTEEFDSITYSKLFGLVGSDEEMKHIKEYDLSDYNTIVFDEVFLYEPLRLKRISSLMEQYPDKHFLATGDSDQRDPIAFKNSNYLTQCMSILFPTQIILNDIKRLKNEQDKETLIELKKDIFNTDISIEAICKKHNLNTVYKLEDVKTKVNISLFNFRCNIVNSHIHKNICKYTETYFNGLDIICRKYERKKNYTINTNYTYKIIKLGKKETKIKDEVENKEFIIPNGVLTNNFKLPYALTLDSVQGLSFDNKITVFDSNTPYVDRKFIWTAITRARELKNVNIFIHSKTEVEKLTQSRIRLYFNMKVENYKTQDNKAKREFNKVDYINEEWINNKIEECNYICMYCKKHMELYIDEYSNVKSNITVDRINNNLSHIKLNSQICCLNCNRIKGNRY